MAAYPGGMAMGAGPRDRRSGRRRSWVSLGLRLATAGLLLPPSATSQLTTVKFLGIPALNNETMEYPIYDDVVQELRGKGINFVPTLTAPTVTSTDYGGLVRSLINTNSSEYDIVMVDVVWPGEYSDKFQDMSAYLPSDFSNGMLPNIYKSGNARGKQVSVPYNVDFGLLYYRTDLLAKYNFDGPPKTWDEMDKMMSVIVPAERKENRNFYGYVGQLNAYEGLTCNFMEWAHSAGGGGVVEDDRTVTVNNPRVMQVVDMMKQWLLPPKSYMPLTSLMYEEQASLKVWLSGNALFHRNWPFAYAMTMSEPSFPKQRNATNSTVPAFGVVGLPGLTPDLANASTLGGWQLGVVKASKNFTAAAIAIQALTSPRFQLTRFQKLGILPILKDLFQSPETCGSMPNCKVFGNLRVAIRPATASSPRYLDVSEQLYLAVNRMLRDDIPLQKGLANLANNIFNLLNPVKRQPPNTITLSDTIGLASVVTSILFSAITIGLFCAVLHLRALRRGNQGKRAAPYASNPYLLVICIACLTAHSAVVLSTGQLSMGLCVAQAWTVILSLSMAASAVAAKNWRVIKFNKNIHKPAGLPLTDLFLPTFFLTLPTTLLLTLWSVFNAPRAMISSPGGGITSDQSNRSAGSSDFYTCSSPDENLGWVFLGCLVAYNGLLVVLGFMLSRWAQDVGPAWNEMRFNGVCMATLAVVNYVLMPMSFLSSIGVWFQYLIRVLSIELCALTVAILTFGPVLWEVSGTPTDAQVARRAPLLWAAAAAAVGEEEDNRSAVGLSSKDQKSLRTGSTSVRHVMGDRMFKGILAVRYGRTVLQKNLSSFRDMRVFVMPDTSLVIMSPMKAVIKASAAAAALTAAEAGTTSAVAAATANGEATAQHAQTLRHKGAVSFNAFQRLEVSDEPGIAFQVRKIAVGATTGEGTAACAPTPAAAAAAALSNAAVVSVPAGADGNIPQPAGFECVINGMFFEFETRSAEASARWRDVFKAIVVAT
ncbi:hypothetical protein HDU96_002036 [Phlyctochytrium bullatum]|nr:hypothetical protein HDU96_002036 [Phlyctochytrium bullatum]